MDVNCCKSTKIIGVNLGSKQPDLRHSHLIPLYNSNEKAISPGGSLIETEKRLTRDEYLALLASADPKLKPIRKSRYYLSENNVYFEIDVYPFWQDKAILEIDLNSPDEQVEIPEFLHILSDVTHDRSYDYRTLAGANL